MNRRKQNEGLLLGLLFLFSLGFLDWTGYWYAALSLLGCLIWGSQVRWSVNAILLAGFSALYFLFYARWYPVGINHVIYYLWGPWTAFLLGKRYGQERRIWPVIVIPVVGMFLHGLLNWYAYSQSDYAYATARIAVDFWRKAPVSVTYMGMLFTPAASACIGLLFARRGRQRLLALLGLGLCLGATVFFANRTLLLICGLLLAWQWLAWLTSGDVPADRKLRAVLFLGLVCLAVCGLLFCETVQSRLMSLKLTRRLLEGEDGASRFSLWAAFFRDGAWLRHPFGGEKLRTGQKSVRFHNLFLDMYQSVGALPTVVFLAFSLRVWAALTGERATEDRNAMGILRCLLLGVLLNCMVEPVIEASPYYFLTVLLWLGAVEGRCQGHTKRGQLCT